MTDRTDQPSANPTIGTWSIPGFVAAWLFPGLGHILQGQRRRGFLILGGTMLLIFAGLLIGGLDVVDSRNHWLWFLAQSGCGPITFILDWLNVQLVDQQDQAAQIARTSLGRVNEMGTLLIALAGLMNIVVMLDALRLPPRDGGTP
jgi:hypothetical protein